jgi:hypothetical protein
MRQYILAGLLVLFFCGVYFLPKPSTDAETHTLPKPPSHPEIPLPTNPHIKPPHPKGELLVTAEETQFWEREHAPGAKLVLKPSLPMTLVAPADLDRYNREGSDMNAPSGSLLDDCMADAEERTFRGSTRHPPIPGCAQRLAAATAAGEILAIPPGSLVQVVERRPGFNWARVSLLRSGLHGPTSAAIRKPYVWLGDAVLRTTEEVRLGAGER